MSNMLYNTLSSIVLVMSAFGSKCQDEIKWSFQFNRAENSIEFKAELKEHWHLYSQHIDEQLGPIPTEFKFEENTSLERIGEIEEQAVKTIFDENFGGQLDILEGTAIFTQKIKWLTPTILRGSILYMLCNDKGCLPPDVIDFEVELN